jgi:hypothetical protein
MPQLVINNQMLASEFFEDALLLGIQCPVKAHRFVWQINRSFGYAFAYQQEAEIQVKVLNRTYLYPVYQCAEPNMELVHLLYVNENDGKHLLPELKHIDFLWLLKGLPPHNRFHILLMQELRKLDQVQLVLELTNEKIKNKEHLIF